MFVYVFLWSFVHLFRPPCRFNAYEVPAVGESGRPRERGFADGATESETWCWKTGETGGRGKTGETFKEKIWVFHEKIGRFDPSGASEIVFFQEKCHWGIWIQGKREGMK